MPAPLEHVQLRVANLDCDSDAARLKRGLASAPGVTELTVYPKSAKVAIGYDPAATSPNAVRDALQALGFPVQQTPGAAGPPVPWRNPKVLTSLASGVLLFAGWLVARASAPASVSIALYVAALLVGGYYFGREALEDLVF